MGYLFGGIAAVANTGDDRNWCGHPFAQANWYAFGRLAWDHGLAAADIADEWIRMTFTSDERFVAPVKEMMLASREAVVDYMTPLGLHHIMAEGHHHGPGPWVDVEDAGRADWTRVYYHRADADGIGFDRTATGSDAVVALPLAAARAARRPRDLPREPAALVSPRPLGPPLVLGPDAVGRALPPLQRRRRRRPPACRRPGTALAPFVDGARHGHVRRLLAIQEQEARWWRNACLLYFQTFSRRPLPAGPRAARGHARRISEHQGVKLPTNDVTDRAGSVALNAPSAIAITGCCVRCWLADVSQGVTPVAVPPATVKSCVRLE